LPARLSPNDARQATEMNRPLFDLEHLRIAAEVRAKAWRRRWLNLAVGLLVLLIMALGVMLALIVLHVRELVQ
jgi:hypothetical protein